MCQGPRNPDAFVGFHAFLALFDLFFVAQSDARICCERAHCRRRPDLWPNYVLSNSDRSARAVVCCTGWRQSAARAAPSELGKQLRHVGCLRADSLIRFEEISFALRTLNRLQTIPQHLSSLAFVSTQSPNRVVGCSWQERWCSAPGNRDLNFTGRNCLGTLAHRPFLLACRTDCRVLILGFAQRRCR